MISNIFFTLPITILITINTTTAFIEWWNTSFSVEQYILCAHSCNQCWEFTLSENIEC